MDKSDIEYLENCLEHTSKQHNLLTDSNKIWYSNNDTVLSVARILDSDFSFRDTSSVIDFFEKPYKGEYEMRQIVKAYKEIQEAKDGSTTNKE
jgi:vacuolar-type H+-ATPase catalytic subunit A/Vma1